MEIYRWQSQGQNLTISPISAINKLRSESGEEERAGWQEVRRKEGPSSPFTPRDSFFLIRRRMERKAKYDLGNGRGRGGREGAYSAAPIILPPSNMGG